MMVIGIFGENCSGKSTLADEIRRRTGAEVISGKDYLRLARSEAEALSLFRRKLEDSEHDGILVYVISEKEQLTLLPAQAKRIYARADLETIKARFRNRMRGVLPPPVEAMLERRHGAFEDGRFDFVYDGAAGDPAAFCDSAGIL